MSQDRMSLIRKIIEQAVPAEEYFAKQAMKTASLKPSADNEVSADPNKTPEEEGLSESELQILHDGLSVLREEVEAEEVAEKKERKSVRELIAWAACDFGVNEEVVRVQVERHFEVSDINELNNGHYDELVRFLENLDIKQFIN
jgi:hypothetical protein